MNGHMCDVHLKKHKLRIEWTGTDAHTWTVIDATRRGVSNSICSGSGYFHAFMSRLWIFCCRFYYCSVVSNFTYVFFCRIWTYQPQRSHQLLCFLLHVSRNFHQRDSFLFVVCVNPISLVQIRFERVFNDNFIIVIKGFLYHPLFTVVFN